jgi:hypothetical protein
VSLLLLLRDLLADAWSWFWLMVLEPHVNEPDEAALPAHTQSSQHESLTTPTLMETREQVIVVPAAISRDAALPKEGLVSDGSFLSQLEQRTQQVKITVANLEAEKARIEALIDRLQPLIPHYDALLAAEHAIQDSNIHLETAAPAHQEHPWDASHQEQHSGWNG